ncbi:hypothetical protein Cgig2_013934 [Carnegiea gigantea]|uniref:GTD-binding domain-containing protein n=1 Tax=Carnegiea gigantea TaxID=171969 RepID=A0A9Q1Q3Z6_9CARY|nr:hypothetical protein Cgig2_013934 [Carnegiea gigantea]
MSLGTNEINFLKETLHAQQDLLQKLYNELDVERESSAIATDEALSMILRLQGEKAAMEMEASQYKRIAEEKMFHAQETLETFQELIYQKEMQIASLEFQVQAYKFKLVSMGCDDLGACEMQYPENLLSRRNGTPGETSHSSMRRGSSVPPPAHKPLSRRASMEGLKSMQSSPKTLEDIKDLGSSIRKERTSGDFNTYWEEIRKLDERVKELDNIKNFNNIPKPEKAKAPSSSPMCNASADSSPTKVDFLKHPEKDPSVQPCGDSPTSVQDIFEVPQCSGHHQEYTSHKKDKGKLVVDVESSRKEKLASMWDEIWKSDVKEKIDWDKTSLSSPCTSNSNSPKPRDVKEKIDWEKKPLNDWEKKPQFSPSSNNDSPLKEKVDWGKKPILSPCDNDDLSKFREGRALDKQSLLRQPAYGVADIELQQFNRRLKQLEDERFIPRGNEINEETGDEQVILLKEIRDKIDLIQAEIASWRNDKPPRSGHPSVGCLRERKVYQKIPLCYVEHTVGAYQHLAVLGFE